MNLKTFLLKVKGEESTIINYIGEERMKAVESDGDALRYVDKKIFVSKKTKIIIKKN